MFVSPIKKVHQLVIKSFIGPFILTFFIALFILLMQFLFKYIDDLVGKGLEWYVVAELIFYASSTFVPMALPLAILLSSIMTFGNLGESYELVALKSSGMSLRRIMMPLIFFVFIVSVSAFFFSNYIMPLANLKMGALMWDVRNQKPSLALKEGIFYNGIEGYSIRVGKKDKDGQGLKDIMIYNHTAGNGNMNVLMADSGRMLKSDNDRFLVLELYNGVNYEESGTPGTINDRKQNMRIRFKQHEVKFDLSTFKMNRTNEDLFKNYHTMLNVKQLVYYEDSLESKQKKDQEYFGNNVLMYTMMKKDLRVDSTLKAEDIPLQSDIIRNFPKKNWPSIIGSSYGVIRNIRSYSENNASDQEQLNKQIRRHVIEFHRKFTLSIACIILFFIGAPLGAIIRKGGLGMPVVISIFFFIFFHILSITGEKMAREGVLPVWEGMWLASMILTPIGIFFTRKATADSALFDINTYLDFFKQIGKVFTRKKQVSP
jgi:lipopolysaccharide export system permease protein